MSILLSRSDVASLLDMRECIDAVELAFAAYGRGEGAPPAILGVHAPSGGFHVKAALDASGRYFAAKLNANFMRNTERFGLPTIQGIIALCDAENGRVLAVMDSIEITILRTAAASAIAAKHLAKAGPVRVAIAGCGNQGRSHVRALSCVREISTLALYDRDAARAESLAGDVGRLHGIRVEVADDFETAARESDVIVTCTPSREPILSERGVSPGAFIAAVGADSAEKWEIDPALMAASTVVTDVTDQCATIGDLHHAIAAGTMTRADVHAELGAIVVGRAPARRTATEIIVFDSTGTALQDVAAAAIVYERATERGIGTQVELGA